MGTSMSYSAITGRNVGANVVSFRFSIGQKVKIDSIETWGIVSALNVDAEGKTYLISYFDDDKVRRKEWLYESELT